MTRDAAGNDLDAVEVVEGGKIVVVEYTPDNVITPEMIAADVATPTLPDAYTSPESAVGLIAADGGPQDSRDADDATEFYQAGYSISAEPTLTTQFTPVEQNKRVRLLTLGEPDEHGVYHVSDIVRDAKWLAYQEESLRGGRVRRRAGAVQITGNEPNQSERGAVKGTALTATWQKDELYGGVRYIESYYDAPDGGVAVTSITADPTALTVEEGKTATIAVTVLPAVSTAAVTAESADRTHADTAVTGRTVTVTGVKATDAGATVDVTISAGGRSVAVPVTVTAGAGA